MKYSSRKMTYIWKSEVNNDCKKRQRFISVYIVPIPTQNRAGTQHFSAESVFPDTEILLYLDQGHSVSRNWRREKIGFVSSSVSVDFWIYYAGWTGVAIVSAAQETFDLLSWLVMFKHYIILMLQGVDLMFNIIRYT